jgi:quinol monooxygenase YgiN
MFARSVAFQLKPGRAADFTQLLDQEIIPTLRKQKGFLDEIALVSLGGANVLAISVWNLKEDAETYARGAFQGVLKSMAQVIEGIPQVQTYDVANSTFRTTVDRASTSSNTVGVPA